jgi:hypothetical protein
MFSATRRSSEISRPAASPVRFRAGVAGGWRGRQLKVTRSPNGSNPLATGEQALFGCDAQRTATSRLRNAGPTTQNWDRSPGVSSAVVAGRQPEFDLAPYRADRF